MKKSMDFSNVKILVVGDVMLDKYLWGSVRRISPEAPVPVVNLEKTTFAPGGAANVAANVAGLGAQAFLIGLVGTDAEADLLCEGLSEKNVSSEFLYRIEERPTTVKTRIIGHNQQIVRIDSECKKSLDANVEKNVLKKIYSLFDKINAIIISDYDKGFLSEKFLSRLIKSANEKRIKILVDPKGKSFKKYKNTSLITPNRNEITEAYPLENFDEKNYAKAGQKILKDLNLESLLVTEGENGMTLFQKSSQPIHFSAFAREVYDVTGAGDTVIASLGVFLAQGKNLPKAVRLANIAAGLIVEQIGTTAISNEMLYKVLKEDFSSSL